jgi:hypothetical protein
MSGVMREYLCPSCLHVVASDSQAPFDWCCNCGQPLDAVSLLTDAVPLSEHPSVKRLEHRARVATFGELSAA